MATILPFIKYRPAFDPDLIAAMSVAFDDVCRKLEIPDTATAAREVVAKRIIQLARSNDDDAGSIRDRTLSELAPEAAGKGQVSDALRRVRCRSR